MIGSSSLNFTPHLKNDTPIIIKLSHFLICLKGDVQSDDFDDSFKDILMEPS